MCYQCMCKHLPMYCHCMPSRFSLHVVIITSICSDREQVLSPSLFFCLSANLHVSICYFSPKHPLNFPFQSYKMQTQWPDSTAHYKSNAKEHQWFVGYQRQKMVSAHSLLHHRGANEKMLQVQRRTRAKT